MYTASVFIDFIAIDCLATTVYYQAILLPNNALAACELVGRCR